MDNAKGDEGPQSKKVSIHFISVISFHQSFHRPFHSDHPLICLYFQSKHYDQAAVHTAGVVYCERAKAYHMRAEREWHIRAREVAKMDAAVRTILYFEVCMLLFAASIQYWYTVRKTNSAQILRPGSFYPSKMTPAWGPFTPL